LEEFLESCRHTSLLAELEDEEELPDADDDDNDDNDEDDDDDYEDYDEEGFVVSSSAGSGSGSSNPAARNVGGTHGGIGSGRRKTWDDEHVLKRKFSALIPAFDPRPGRTNVQQTSDIDITPPGSDEAPAASPPPEEGKATPIVDMNQPRLQLCLRGPSLPGIIDVEIELGEPEWTIFRAVQYVMQASNLGVKGDKIRRVWEPTYVIVYKELNEKESSPSSVEGEMSSATRRSSASSVLPQLPILSQSHCSMDEILQLLRQLYIISTEKQQGDEEKAEKERFGGTTDVYHSKRITNKLVQQIQDPLILSANAMPDWCHELTFSCPMLFPFDTRLLYFQCTAFGASRSIVWLQNQRDQNAERARSGARGPGRGLGGADELHEFRVGRIKHERVKVSRNDRLLDWALQVMKTHSDRKAILEVEFLEEEGTGLGPTLEFFALVAAELQRKDLAMWVCDDVQESGKDSEKGGQEQQHVVPDSDKPPGYYVSRPNGLFPAPLPQDSELCSKVSKLFWFLGVFLAKTLQDNRLVDLPLSYPLLKLLCQGEVSALVKEKSHIVVQSQTSNDGCIIEDPMTSSMYSILSEESDLDTNASQTGQASPFPSSGAPWFAHLLDFEDLVLIDPERGEFLLALQDYVAAKQAIDTRTDVQEGEKAALVDNLSIKMNGHDVRPEDLTIAMQYSPGSAVFEECGAYDLGPNGDNEFLNATNAEDYFNATLDFALNSGIRRQLDAFRSGFNTVFPMDKLGSFSPEEVRTMLCGDGCPAFVKEDVVRYTEPKLGYSRDSAAFEKFVNVLVGFNARERKSFLQFTTGCSSLPPGKKEGRNRDKFGHHARNMLRILTQLFFLFRWPCQPSSPSYDRAQDRRRRWLVPERQHLRPLP
jgi:E3 ubiquitin-protein ligase HECTD1